jgi:ligand-binding sensor domain-containing protein
MIHPNDTTSLINNNVTGILIDRKNRVWIGTSGGSVNQFIPESKTFKRVNSATAHLSNDYVSNLMETSFGYVMIATSKGFSLLNPETGKIRNFGNENGMPLNSLYNGGMCVTKNNLLYVAG